MLIVRCVTSGDWGAFQGLFRTRRDLCGILQHGLSMRRASVKTAGNSRCADDGFTLSDAFCYSHHADSRLSGQSEQLYKPSAITDV